MALLVGFFIFWKGDSDDEEQSPGMEGSERVTKSPRERQLQDVRTKSARVLTVENAQGKIEDFPMTESG